MFFHAMFFIISGYCSNFTHCFKKFIIKQWKQILLPWICFEFIVKILWAIYLQNFNSDYFIQEFYNLFIPPNTGLWFFSALFFSKLYLWCLIRLSQSIIIKLSIGLFLLLIGLICNQYNLFPNVLAIQNSLVSCFFVTLGFALKNIEQCKFEDIIKKGTILFLISIILYKELGFTMPILDANVSNVGWVYIPIILIYTISGSCACLYLSKYIKLYWLEYFGKNSIIIYGLHFIPLMCLIKIYYNILTPYNYLTMLLLTIIIYSSLFVVLVLLIKLFNSKYFKWIIGR